MSKLVLFNNKKIIMIAPTPFFSDRGCHLQILETYKDLSLRNKVEVFTYGLGRNTGGIMLRRVYNFPWYTKIDPGPSIEKTVYDLFLFISIFGQSLRKKPDYYYCHLHEGAMIGLLLKAFFKSPVIFDMQGSLVEELIQAGWLRLPFLKRGAEALEKYLVNNSDIIYVSSKQFRTRLVQGYNISKKISTKNPYEKLYDQQSQLMRQLKLPKNKTIIGYLGGLQKSKGVYDFLDVIPRVHSKFHFLIMGYPVEHSLLQKIRDLKLTNRITLTGKVLYEETFEALKHCSYLFSPKRLVLGQANSKLYTYKTSGKRTLCYNYSEFQKILGKQGIYVDVSKDNWADTINSLEAT